MSPEIEVTDLKPAIEEYLKELEDEDEEQIRKRSRKPPSEGPCKRCGEDRPLNRLMLCYSCWTKTVLEEKFGWREGQPHPDACNCEIPSQHKSKDGTERGNN